MIKKGTYQTIFILQKIVLEHIFYNNICLQCKYKTLKKIIVIVIIRVTI